MYWLATFSTGHFNPGISLSCVTLVRTDGSFHLGQAVTSYLCQDIDLGYKPHIFQYFVFVCILIGHIAMTILDSCRNICSVQDSCFIRIFWFWPLALKRRLASLQFSWWMGEVGNTGNSNYNFICQFKLQFYLLRKYLLFDASLVIIFITHRFGL